MKNGFSDRLIILLFVMVLIPVALASCSTARSNDPLLTLPRANEANEPPLPEMQDPPPHDLVVGDLKQGSGDPVEEDRLLVVNFVVSEWGSADVLDSTSRRGIARIWPYGSAKLIPGIEEGLEGMREGGRRLVVVPPSLAYGDEPLAGTTGELPLIFVVDLIEVFTQRGEQG